MLENEYMNNNKQRQSYPFYISFYEAINTLDESKQLLMYKAITEYSLFKAEPDFGDKILELIWIMVKPQLDATWRKFENSLGGGCPKGTKKPQMLGNQNARKENKTKTKPKQNLNKTETKPNQNQNETKTKPNSNNNINSNINNNENINDNNLELSTKVANSLSTEVDSAESINWVALAEFWNNAMKDKAIPKVKVIADSRQAAVKARMAKYGKESIVIAIQKAAESSFMNGDNKKNWIATFDFVFGPKNFPKVLDGNFDNKLRNGNARTEAVPEYDDKLYHPDLPDNFRPAW